ncbi:hypothetical protein VG1_CDS0008 [Arthrobacter phage Cupello]|nr:hypothetical protein VG1_CDS0008 [Arthrobacter phage Cupello]
MSRRRTRSGGRLSSLRRSSPRGLAGRCRRRTLGWLRSLPARRRASAGTSAGISLR